MMNTVGIINHDIVLPSYRYLNEILGSFKRKFFPRLNKVECQDWGSKRADSIYLRLTISGSVN